MNTDRIDVLAVMAALENGPEPDPDTGADRGSCCEHAYANGWNDCIRSIAEARAAVAELIAANKAVIAALSAPGAPTKTERNEMIAALSAALARVGGGA